MTHRTSAQYLHSQPHHSYKTPCLLQHLPWEKRHYFLSSVFPLGHLLRAQGLLHIKHNVCLSLWPLPSGAIVLCACTGHVQSSVWQAFRNLQSFHDCLNLPQVKQAFPVLIMVPQMIVFQVYSIFPGTLFWMGSFWVTILECDTS